VTNFQVHWPEPHSLLPMYLSLTWLATAMIGAVQLAGVRMGEKWINRICHAQSWILLLGAIALGGPAIFRNTSETLLFPPWYSFEDYRFDLSLVLDRLGSTYALLTAFIYFVIIRFSSQYLHRESGHARFFLLLSTLSAALTTLAYAGNLEILYGCWEIIGIASVLLISFFRKNIRSAQNSLRALVSYRICDAAFLGAAVWLHHSLNSTDFRDFATAGAAPYAVTTALFLILASLAKSAQVPLSTWFHRAMEGPTPSSAIFYGALSVHLGPFLLLRTFDLWGTHFEARLLVGAIGLISAAYGSWVGKTRTDAKTGLAYATLAQVGLIYCEVAFGLKTLALIHVVTHAGLRTFQYLRTSSLIHDILENPLVVPGTSIQHLKIPKRLYIHALNGFYLEAILNQFLLRPFHSLFIRASRLEHTLAQGLGHVEDRLQKILRLLPEEKDPT